MSSNSEKMVKIGVHLRQLSKIKTGITFLDHPVYRMAKTLKLFFLYKLCNPQTPKSTIMWMTDVYFGTACGNYL